MTASHRVFDAITPPMAESGRFRVGSGLRPDVGGSHLADQETRDRGTVALFSMLVRRLPLSSAVVASSNDGAPRIVAWTAPSMADVSVERHVLPTLDREGSFAGALSFETHAVLSEGELAFARAVASEIGRVGGAPAVVHSQRALLASVAPHPGATRLATVLSTIATVCVIDHGERQWVSVPDVSSWVDHERVTGLVDHLVGASGDPRAAWCAKIERGCRTLSDGDRALVAQLGLHSILHVPIASENARLDERVVMLGGGNDSPFEEALLRCVDDLVRDGAASDGNAHLHRAALAGVRYRSRDLVVVSHRRARGGSFVTLVEPATVADPESAHDQLRDVRRAALRLSHVL